MDKVLNKKIGVGVLVYLDDVVIFGKSFDEHCEHLDEVLKTLDANKLKCKPEKCCFGYKEIKFLGHSISVEGIKPDPDKISTIVDAIVPTCEKDIPRFFGLCSYYRKFIKNFSQAADPIYYLLRKGIEFRWGKRQDNAFRELKKLLS